MEDDLQLATVRLRNGVAYRGIIQAVETVNREEEPTLTVRTGEWRPRHGPLILERNR